MKSLNITPRFNGLVIYENGVARPNAIPRYGCINVLAFGASPERLYGYNNETSSFDFYRLRVDSEGVSIIDNHNISNSDLIQGFGSDIQFDSGVIYTSSGRAIDPEKALVLGSFGNFSAWPVRPDVASGYVFYLSGDYSARIDVFDSTRYALLGTYKVPGAKGVPYSLIRWGANGLAFCTTTGQVWLVEGLVPSPPYTVDMSSSQTVTPQPAQIGDFLTYTIVVKNNSEYLAHDATLYDVLPNNGDYVSATSTQGTCSHVTSNFVACNIGDMQAGQTVTILLTVRAVKAGRFTNTTHASAFESDSNFTNNGSRLDTSIHFSGRLNVFEEMDLPTNDIITDPHNPIIYASIPKGVGDFSNTIVPISLPTGELGKPIPVGINPTILAISDNAQYLYAGIFDEAAVERVDLGTQAADLKFPLGGDNFLGPYYPQDIAVQPDHPDTVAVSRLFLGISPQYGDLALYVNGVQRPNEVTHNNSRTISNFIEFGATSDRLYGSDSSRLLKIQADASGLTLLSSKATAMGSKTDIRFDDGLLYGSYGNVINPETGLTIGRFSGADGPVRPDSRVNRVFFLTYMIGGYYKLAAYDLTTFVPKGDLLVFNLYGTPTNLIRWGEDGLAFCTSSGQLFFVRTDLVPPPTMLNGQILLQECVQPEGTSITFEFRPYDGRSAFIKTTLLGAEGRFRFEVPAGEYEVRVKGKKWLARTINLAISDGTTQSNLSLLAGDANNDNTVNIFDLGTLAESFNTILSDPLWNENCDFNCDNSVDIFDLCLLAENFNRDGDL